MTGLGCWMRLATAQVASIVAMLIASENSSAMNSGSTAPIMYTSYETSVGVVVSGVYVRQASAEQSTMATFSLLNMSFTKVLVTTTKELSCVLAKDKRILSAFMSAKVKSIVAVSCRADDATPPVSCANSLCTVNCSDGLIR
jgi:hypothetical protein